MFSLSLSFTHAPDNERNNWAVGPRVLVMEWVYGRQLKQLEQEEQASVCYESGRRHGHRLGNRVVIAARCHRGAGRGGSWAGSRALCLRP